MTVLSTAVMVTMGRYATTNAPYLPNRERIVPDTKSGATPPTAQPDNPGSGIRRDKRGQVCPVPEGFILYTSTHTLQPYC